VKRLKDSAQQITDALNSMKDTQEVSNDLSNKVTELNIIVNQKEAAKYGLSPQQVAQAVNQATRGLDAAQMTTDSNKVLTVHVAYDPSITNTRENLKKLLIPSQTGNYIALKDVADITNGKSPVVINRTDQERAVGFKVKFSNQTTLGEYKAAVQQHINDLDLNSGTEVSYTGSFNLLQDSMNQLIMAFILAVVLVYLVMAAQFESFKYPFVILLSIPLIFIGVSIGLYSTQTPISATALIGLVVLAGIVVNNAIVLVDYILQLKGRGYSTYTAIVESVQLRTRPILMTALTTILGLVPVAFGIGDGTEIQQPMAITVIGGMISSTFLTLFVIPIIFSYFDKETRRRSKE
jgi:HAE1 family hydrophobic/amphiphilic exporter-1